MRLDRPRTGVVGAAPYDRTAAAPAALYGPFDPREAGSDPETDPYRLAVQTDVQRTWRKYGWVPPSELTEYQEKWTSFKLSTIAGLISN
jgi:hypothetical protein